VLGGTPAIELFHRDQVIMERFNIRELLATRANQGSFHVASEEHLRVEFRNMSAGEELESFRYGGNVVLTICSGVFVLKVDGSSVEVSEMDQVITSTGESIGLQCKVAGAIQTVWSPAHAQTEKTR
jgi:hypothetical protein